MSDEAKRKAQREYMKNRYHEDPEHRERVKSRVKKWQQENRERLRVQAKERYRVRRANLPADEWAAMRANAAARTRKWQAKNKKHVYDYATERKKTALNRVLAEKAARGCLRCGERDPRCLDFHHRDHTSKVAEVSRLIGHKPATLDAEIAKCDVICANCHRKEHDGNRANFRRSTHA